MAQETEVLVEDVLSWLFKCYHNSFLAVPDVPHARQLAPSAEGAGFARLSLEYEPRCLAVSPEGPRVAVEGIETEGGRRIVLFTSEKLDLREANAKLMEQGLRGVMRLDEVKQIDKIPVLGTGKTDYKALRALISK